MTNDEHTKEINHGSPFAKVEKLGYVKFFIKPRIFLGIC